MAQDADVVVVGGGLAGLATATLAARGGKRVLLLERSSALGGRARSQAQEEGFRFNLGPHALYRQGAAARVLAGLGIHPTGTVPGAGGFALRGKRVHTLPSGPVSLLTTDLLPLGEKLELARALTGLARADAASFAGLPLSTLLQTRVRSEGARAVAATLFRIATY